MADGRDKTGSVTRRNFCMIGAGAAAMALSGSARAAQRERPNILFLMVDQFRPDCIGADGNRAIRTPNLDRIAYEGIRFPCAYSSTPTCTPARAGLLTGLSPWNHGMLGYARVGERYAFEKPRALRDAGYHTIGIGKMHWHPQRNMHGLHELYLDESGRAETPGFVSDYRAWFAKEAPGLSPDATGIGFNEFRSGVYALPENLHPTHWTAQTAIDRLKAYDQAEPFYMKVSFARPHSPYDPPKRFWDMYESADLPPAVVGKWAARHAPRSDDGPNIWHGDLGPEQVRKSRQGYYGSVSFIDEQIGRILETLEERGLLEETLILLTADHGDMTGDHHMWRKSYAYEASARIPMLMRWPEGLVAGGRGQVCRAPVELRDVLPTFLDAAGAAIPDSLDGRSMLDLARGKAEGWREFIDLEHDICYDAANHWNALTDGRWKYIFHARDGEEQLFDLKSDPGEINDLAHAEAGSDSAPAPDYAGELRKWRGRMIEHLSVRGEEFVKDGQLALRPKSRLLSPNHPGCSCHPKKG
ncbi:MAG TPA: arylsulfatase [Candidatus Brocadiia bacterium]|nr:arylsulfatase [Candidatus Brocadiia bacterium]